MQFKLTGLIIPKARPRVHNGRATTQTNYREWKNQATYELRLQHKGVIICTSVDIILIGKHHRKSDADNIAGSCLDALVQSGILINDSMAYITKLSIELKHSQESPYTLITLK